MLTLFAEMAKQAPPNRRPPNPGCAISATKRLKLQGQLAGTPLRIQVPALTTAGIPNSGFGRRDTLFLKLLKRRLPGCYLPTLPRLQPIDKLPNVIPLMLGYINQ